MQWQIEYPTHMVRQSINARRNFASDSANIVRHLVLTSGINQEE